jgi:hypothetical protein
MKIKRQQINGDCFGGVWENEQIINICIYLLDCII